MITKYDVQKHEDYIPNEFIQTLYFEFENVTATIIQDVDNIIIKENKCL